MRAVVRMSFPLSRDGIKVELVKVGAVEEIPDALFPGLEAAGFVTSSDHDALSPDTEREPAAAEDLRVKHAGGGRWWLVRGDDRIRGPFGSKAEAEAAR